MKTKNILTLTLLVITAFVAATVVSCKKESSLLTNDNNNPTTLSSTFTPPQVDDMNAYLKEFKQRLTNSKEDEAMELEEAAWHLSSLANFDFGHANVAYNDIRFDTLYGHIDLADGKATLQSLAETYADIASSIDAFYHSLPLEEKHFRFINVLIGEDGSVIVPITTTFMKNSRYLGDTMYYFPNGSSYHLDTLAFHFFGDTIYIANSTAIARLNYLLNLLEGKPMTDPLVGKMYYIITRFQPFHYSDYIDPFGSPYQNNSRLYAGEGVVDSSIEPAAMLYLLDSYLGLGLEHLIMGEDIINWNVVFGRNEQSGTIYFHDLVVGYGYGIMNPNPNEY